VADRWFEHETVDDGVLRIREPHVDPFLQANLFLVRGRDRDLLVDTGLGIGSLRGELAELFERPTIAVASWRARSVPSSADGPEGARLLGEGAGHPAFAAPAAGSWTVEVHVAFDGGAGDASYFWRLEVT